ncbi:hypothetical protein KW797_02295 [Candidatus Parcubacteria bacterium]|nr:hypothetical protein [Candidatus Parcubacteria bacterium]
MSEEAPVQDLPKDVPVEVDKPAVPLIGVTVNGYEFSPEEVVAAINPECTYCNGVGRVLHARTQESLFCEKCVIAKLARAAAARKVVAHSIRTGEADAAAFEAQRRRQVWLGDRRDARKTRVEVLKAQVEAEDERIREDLKRSLAPAETKKRSLAVALTLLQSETKELDEVVELAKIRQKQTEEELEEAKKVLVEKQAAALAASLAKDEAVENAEENVLQIQKNIAEAQALSNSMEMTVQRFRRPSQELRRKLERATSRLALVEAALGENSPSE